MYPFFLYRTPRTCVLDMTKLTQYSLTGINDCGLTTKAIGGIILTRLVILPCLGCFIVHTVRLMNLVPPDPLFHFVLLLQFCMPTAINVGQLLASLVTTPLLIQVLVSRVTSHMSQGP